MVMVTSNNKKGDSHKHRSPKNSIKADVIILGCSLPGIVTAHKLKKKFGDTMDIMVLDLSSSIKTMSKGNVAFHAEHINVDEEESDVITTVTKQNVHRAKYYLTKYALDFNIPIPAAITGQKADEPHKKIFQHVNGTYLELNTNYHDFKYLNFLERFELKQYQRLLDAAMKSLFNTNAPPTAADKKLLLYYDQTSMEKHLSGELFFATSKDIMRAIVRVVCGASPKHVSVLFYLHQCFRTRGSTNHIDGENIRLREKVLGYCRKRISAKLYNSIADITLRAKPITEIRTYSDEEVILETVLGETNYICNLLAMALSPDELNNIKVENNLISEEEVTIAGRMMQGRLKRFLIQYETNIWRNRGFSGDIVSTRGPIIWAIERPQMSGTGATEKYASLTGLLSVPNLQVSHEDSVIEQLVLLFGEEATNRVSYSEKNIDDILIPGLGDYLTLYRMTVQQSSKYLVWAAFDVFAEGDLAAGIEAGHRAYLHLMSLLRPQAKNFDDMVMGEYPTTLQEWPLTRAVTTVGIRGVFQYLLFGSAILYGFHILRSYFRKAV